MIRTLAVLALAGAAAAATTIVLAHRQSDRSRSISAPSEAQRLRWLGLGSSRLPHDTPATAALRRRFGARAASAGARLERVSFLRGRPPVPDVTVQIDDVDRFVRQGGAGVFKILGPERGHERRLLQVVDRSGAPILISAQAGNGGSTWIRPGLDPCGFVWGCPVVAQDPFAASPWPPPPQRG